MQFGTKYRDKVTGFVGVATGHAEYNHEKPQTRLEAVDASERPVVVWELDERLEAVE